MEYVMVPVPEEHAEDVEQYVRWMAGNRTGPAIDQDAIREAVSRLDPDTRALLSVLVGHSPHDGPLTIAQAAEELGCSPREALGTLVGLNAALMKAGGLGAAITHKAAASADPIGDRAVWVPERVADAVSDLADASGR